MIRKRSLLAELKACVRSLLQRKFSTENVKLGQSQPTVSPDELEHAKTMLVEKAVRLMAVRDGYTAGHCQRVARYAAQLSQYLGLAESDVEVAVMGGVLHDLGKIGIPDAVLLKPGPLNKAERAKMKEHVVIGEKLLQGPEAFQAAALVVRHHHERYDGSGYPDGLRREAIPQGGRMEWQDGESLATIFDLLLGWPET